MKTKIQQICWFACFVVLLSCFSCSSTSESEKNKHIDYELRSYIRDWIGTPYKLGGNSHNGIDCSALTQNIYKHVFRVELPRRVVEQRVEGLPVKRDSLLAGDLIVFKRQIFGRPHIGVYLSNNEFVHASSSHGVMISNLSNSFWRRKFKAARRLIDKNGDLVKDGVAVD
jgi:cell wall-associated NlpC family hydrolase